MENERLNYIEIANAKLVPIERAIISACLERKFPAILAEGITPEMFTKKEHQMIFAAMIQNDILSNECDLSSVGALLANEPETVSKLVECTDQGAGTQNLSYSLRVVKNAFRRRSLLRSLNDLMNAILTADFLAEFPFEEKIIALIESNQSSSCKTSCTRDGLAMRTLQAIENDIDKTGMSNLLRVGNGKIDRVLGLGFKPKQLITIAARTGCGKTTLATNIALNAALRGRKPLYITIELDEMQIMERLYCTHAGIDTQDMASHKLSQEQWDRAYSSCKTMVKTDFFVNSETNGSWEKVEIAIKNACKYKGVDSVFIDYIQQFHVTTKKMNTREEITYMTSRCKQLAMEFNIPIIIVAQLNRDIEKRADKYPMLSDLKESGSIEQDSDVVLMLWITNENEYCKPGIKEKIALKIAKNRSGKTGNFWLDADLSTNKIFDSDDLTTFTDNDIATSQITPLD